MKSRKSVRHNSPNPSQYHENVSDMPGTMIPRSNKEGVSLGFDHNKPGKVVVDPGVDGGGFAINMADIARNKDDFNNEASTAEAIEDPSTFFRTTMKQASQVRKTNKTKPSTSKPSQSVFNSVPLITPLSDDLDDDQVEENETQTQDTNAMIDELIDDVDEVERHEKQKAERVFREIQQQRKNTDNLGSEDHGPSMEILLRQLNQQGAALNALISATMESKMPKSATKEKPVVEQVDKAGTPTNIDFLTSKPQRPQYETYFEMEKMGTMAARYHAVIDGHECLALVYDTRFEDGFQYLPPNLGQEKISVSVPKLSKTPFLCSSLGLHWSLGCLDVIVLIKNGA